MISDDLFAGATPIISPNDRFSSAGRSHVYGNIGMAFYFCKRATFTLLFVCNKPRVFLEIRITRNDSWTCVRCKLVRGASSRPLPWVG